MITRTAGDIVRSAYRKCWGSVASGETLSASQMRDGMDALILLLDSWSADRLSVFSTQDQVFTWPASTASQTIGPSGDFHGNRPVGLDDATYFKDPSNGVSYPIQIINQQQYDSIALKTATSTYPQVIWCNMDMPDMGMTVYPVPNRALEWHFISVTELTQPASSSTPLYLPPGYYRALVYNLAVEICNEQSMEPPATTQRIAVASKRSLKAQNSPGDVMMMPSELIGRRHRFNIYSGELR